MIGDPNSWGAPYKAMQSGLAAFGHNAVNTVSANNLYHDGTSWRYIANGAASLISQSGGEFFYYPVASGTAGATASVGSASFKLDVNGVVQLLNGQLKFPATQNPSSDANTLDDYEEGTWTPALKFGGNNVGMIGSFGGKYTKVGNVVTFACLINCTNKGSSTGTAQILGLPFTTGSNGINGFFAASYYVAGGSVTLSAGTYLAPNVEGNAIDLNFTTTTTGQDGNLTQSSFGAVSSFWITGSYFV